VSRTAGTYLIHGLRLRSELALAEPEAPGAQLDLRVDWAEPAAIPASAPKGETIVELELPGLEYAIVRGPTGYVARFPSLCEFRISADLRAIRIQAAPGADLELLAALLLGNVLAFVLGMAGETVLHASAVEADGAALAILGAPGAGKSTLAAHLCLAGAHLITDDTMRIGIDDPGPHCFQGTHRLRLRAGAAADLAERFDPELRTKTADGRIALGLTPSCDPRPRLEALVVSELAPDAPAVEIRRLRAREAVTALIANSRLVGWTRTAELRPQFAALTQLAEIVPVVEARIPWRDPRPPGLGEELLARIRSLEALPAPGARR
jgi:hypothetical protein